jgi:hypothetical protein
VCSSDLGGIFKTRSIGEMDQGTKRLYDVKSRKAITSGNLKEVPDKSVLMKFFLKELETNSAQFLSSDQFFSKIRQNILNNSNTEPQYGVIQGTGDEGGEFIFYNASVSSIADANENAAMVATIQNKEKRIVNNVFSEKNRILDKPKRVAILSFDNTSGKISEFGELGGPLRDMIVSDLSGVENLQMIDRQALEKVLNEQNLNNSKSFDAATATKTPNQFKVWPNKGFTGRTTIRSTEEIRK